MRKSRSAAREVLAIVSSCFLFSTTLEAATAVDTELVIMVDAQTSSVSDFDLIIESAARLFERPSLQDAVMNGLTGKMAASVMLFNAPGESMQVSWTELSSVSDFQNFASSVRLISYPNAGGNVNYATAISTGSAQLAGNAFTGTNRQITIIDDATGFYAANATGTKAARDAALASNVDVINAIAFDAQYTETAINNFYTTNVVGGGGTVAVVSTPQGGQKSAQQIALVETGIVGTATSPTAVATAAYLETVPEPSVLLLSGLGAVFLLRRRR